MICRHCGRPIIHTALGWIDPEATGDDAVWRETCERHDTFVANHEPGLTDEELCIAYGTTPEALLKADFGGEVLAKLRTPRYRALAELGLAGRRMLDRDFEPTRNAAFLSQNPDDAEPVYLLGQEYGYAKIPNGWTPVQANDAHPLGRHFSDELAARTAAFEKGVAFKYFESQDPDEQPPTDGIGCPGYPGDWAIQWEPTVMGTDSDYVRKFLDLATSHLPEEIFTHLGSHELVIAWPTEWGAFMWVPDDVDARLAEAEDDEGILRPNVVPPEIVAIWRHARSLGCDYVLFDCDGPTNENLPTWSW